MKHCIGLLIIAASVLLVDWAPAWAVGRLYFSNPSSIEIADTNGANQSVLIPGLTHVRRIKVAGDKVYWVQTSGPAQIPGKVLVRGEGSV